MRVETLNDERMVLDVNLAESAGAQRPFAALRSMFVSEGNSDVARVGWRAKDSERWLQEPVMDFKRATACRAVDRTAGALAPQSERARHGVQGISVAGDITPVAKTNRRRGTRVRDRGSRVLEHCTHVTVLRFGLGSCPGLAMPCLL